MREIQVIRPSGESKKLKLESSFAGTLLEFLVQNRHPLNSRCGGRGVCRGCLVELKTGPTSNFLRSCQISANGLPDSLNALHIPAASWQDYSLHGISQFEILLPVRNLHPRSGFGLAIDIGTTTVAACLWDLQDLTCRNTASRSNRQARYGDNVLSRISYSIDNAEGPKHLQEALLKQSLRPMILDMARESGIRMNDIGEATVSGNPIMLHTFLGLPLKGFSSYPFAPEFLDTRICKANQLGWREDMKFQLLPGLGPFVGADIAAGALAAGFLDADPPVLLIDFGTNGEMILKHASGYFATATAVGPAFEGGRLQCGAAARDGVIATLQWNESDWIHSLCGNNHEAEVIGISGAAYIDFLAVARSHGILNAFGRFKENAPGVFAPDAPEDSGKRIIFENNQYISETDIAELIQAKAAIAGGVATLLELANLKPEDLKAIYVAGGFGYYLNSTHARTIGLLPDLPDNRIHVIGNASLGGASLLLQAPDYTLFHELIQNTEIIELNQTKNFEDHFTDALMLEPMES